MGLGSILQAEQSVGYATETAKQLDPLTLIWIGLAGVCIVACLNVVTQMKCVDYTISPNSSSPLQETRHENDINNTRSISSLRTVLSTNDDMTSEHVRGM